MVARSHIARQVRVTKSRAHDSAYENGNLSADSPGSATRLATKCVCVRVQFSDRESAPPTIEPAHTDATGWQRLRAPNPTQRVVDPSESICEKGELHALHVAQLDQVREQPISAAWCTLREDP